MKTEFSGVPYNIRIFLVLNSCTVKEIHDNCTALNMLRAMLEILINETLRNQRFQQYLTGKN